MSAEAVGWVWSNSPYEDIRMLVHLALADVVNDAHNNEFWMGQSELAKKARISRQSANKILSEMVDDGYLELVENRQKIRKPNVYRFLMPEGGETEPLTPPCQPGGQDLVNGVDIPCQPGGQVTQVNSSDTPTPDGVGDGGAALAVIHGVPTYRDLLAQRLGSISTRSFDVLQTYLDTWDAMMDMGSQVGEFIGLAIHYVEYVSGETTEARTRAMIAKHVRKHGKIALMAWDKCLYVTEQDSSQSRMAYAQGVINRTIAEMEADGADQPNADDTGGGPSVEEVPQRRGQGMERGGR